MTTTTTDIRRADDRFVTDAGWLDSKHSFSFGHHRELLEGDAVRIVAADGQRLTAISDDTEVLAWEMHAALA